METRLQKRFQMFKVLCLDRLQQNALALNNNHPLQFRQLHFAKDEARNLREVFEFWVGKHWKNWFAEDRYNYLLDMVNHVIKTDCLHTMGDAQFATFIELCKFCEADSRWWLNLDGISIWTKDCKEALKEIIQCDSWEEAQEVLKRFNDPFITQRIHSIDITALTLAKHFSSEAEKFFLKHCHKRFGDRFLSHG